MGNEMGDEQPQVDSDCSDASISRRTAMRAGGALAFAPVLVGNNRRKNAKALQSDDTTDGTESTERTDETDETDDTDDAEGEAQWRTGPPMPEARTEVEAVERDGTMLVIGGITPDRTAARTIATYDPEMGSWRQRLEFPEGVHHTSAVVLGDAVHVVGGYTDDFGPVDSHWILRLGEWSEGPPLPTARGALTTKVVGDRIVAVGGANDDGPLGVVEIYDPEAESWESGAELPTPREHLASGVVGETLYAIGGREGDLDTNLDANEAYDIEADEWTEREPMPTARGGIDGTVRDDEVFVFGGEGPDGTFGTVEAYDPEEDSWRELPGMPTPRHGLGTALVGDEIYTASGGPEPGFTYSDVLEILSFEEMS